MAQSKKEIWTRQNNKRRSDPEYRKRESIYYKNWYAKNGRNRADNYIEATLHWKYNHPRECKAHAQLNKAVKKGEIIRPNSCEKCSRIARLSGHHIDYSKPLEVMWLCSSCHKLIHIKTTKR